MSPDHRHSPRPALALACAGLFAMTTLAVASQEPLRHPREISRPGNTVPVTLTARNGSARVPGIGIIDGLYLYGASPDAPGLLPALWQVRQGQTLRLALKNRLTCGLSAGADRAPPDQTNIHTHGLIVSPHDKDGRGKYGDFSYVIVNSSGTGCTESPPSHAHHGALPSEAGQAEYEIRVPDSHPSGLYWYHPHVHSIAGAQVGGGMSGLIAVGQLWDYAFINCSPAGSGPRACGGPIATRNELQARALTDQHYLMLKDIQMARGTAGRWQYDPVFEPGLCNSPGTGSNPGYCDSSDGKKRWLFTVNGQHQPTIRVGAGRGAVLRVANVSANVTHVLRLRIQGADGRTFFLPFQVLSVDGVAKSTATAGPATSSSVLLMPAARAELYLSSAAACRWLAQHNAADLCQGTLRATLEQKGLFTGADTWPQADLATIVLETGGARAEPVLQVAGGLADYRAAAASRSAAPTTAALATARQCQDGSPALTLDQNRGEYRLIALKNGACINGPIAGCNPSDPATPETFGMVTEAPRVLSNTPADALPSRPYREFAHDRVDLCVGAPIGRGDYSEIWIVSNQAGELHNFHVHQAKFEVIETNPGGRPDVASIRPTKEGLYHDTYPIDPGGWIKLRIRFNQPEQVGKFAYHCHILEHEDKGMMSVIEVVDTTPR